MPLAQLRQDYELITAANVGAPNTAVTGITVEEKGNAFDHQTIINLTAVPITVANTTGVSFGGVKLYDFPEGLINVKGVLLKGLSVGLTNAGNATPITGAMGGDVSLGTTIAGDGTLTAADVNLLPSTSIDPISGGVVNAILAAPTCLNGATTPIDVFFNMLIDDADVGDAASDVLELTCVIIINWNFGGD